MGQAAGLISALTHCCECPCCSDFARYVLNASRCSSDCCGLISISFETDAISLASDSSEEELQVESLGIKWHKK